MNSFLRPDNQCVFRFECHKAKSDGENNGERREEFKSVSAVEKEEIFIITKGAGNVEREVAMSDHLKFRKMELWTYTIVLLNMIADVSFDQSLEKQMLSKKGDKPIITLSVV